MSVGPWQIILIVLLIVLLFGRGKISSFMEDLGKGMKSFKDGMEEEQAKPDAKPKAKKAPAKKKASAPKKAPAKKAAPKKTPKKS